MFWGKKVLRLICPSIFFLVQKSFEIDLPFYFLPKSAKPNGIRGRPLNPEKLVSTKV